MWRCAPGDLWARPRVRPSALAGLKPLLLLVDDVDAALTADQLVVAVARAQGFQRITDFHGSGPNEKGRTSGRKLVVLCLISPVRATYAAAGRQLCSGQTGLPLPSATKPTYIRTAVLRGACWTVFPGLIDLFGSCPCPCPWTWAHGAHLRCRFPGSMSHGSRGPHFPCPS
jgi:hypothetical protein